MFIVQATGARIEVLNTWIDLITVEPKSRRPFLQTLPEHFGLAHFAEKHFAKKHLVDSVYRETNQLID
jgi:hypothetical protein